VPAPINAGVDGIPAEDDRPTEAQKVEAWRLEQLLAAGYPIHEAEQLAVAPWHDVDLHEAVELVTVRGCPPSVAFRILA
jgi:hypothetical protein